MILKIFINKIFNLSSNKERRFRSYLKVRDGVIRLVSRYPQKKDSDADTLCGWGWPL